MMIGTLLGNRYELLEKIGQGGMAEVYKAKCHLLNRFVSVKILKEEYSQDRDFVEKFKREATAAASLSDNNIVNIYDVGTQDNINYIVMEYINGKTLKEIILDNGGISCSTAIDIAIQIAKALDCAHKNNIVHRDIKPHNILVTEEGVVKVTDFGIAKASNSVTITNTSKIMGSAHYFSPEQAKGSFVDNRTDIYSLGIVLYEMVTGRVPYDAESPVSVALKHIQEPVVPPKQLNDAIPEGLNKLILKAIEKEPIRRYQNARDILSDLQKLKNNSSYNIVTNNFNGDETRIMDAVKIDEPDLEYKKPISKNKKRAILISVAAVLIVTLGIVLGYLVSGGGGKESTSGGGLLPKKETTVPTIVGLSQDEAKKAVEDKKLKFVLIGSEKSDKPEGTVIRVHPEEGKTVMVGSEVRVSVSGGTSALTIPNFVETDLKFAKDFIANNGLLLGSVTEKYSDSPKGTIIEQTPAADSPANKDTKINLVVSKGPETKYVSMPDLTGKTLNEATSILSALKLKLGTVTSVDTIVKDLDGKIFNQSEDKNKNIVEGTTVDVSCYKFKETESKNVNVPDFKGMTVAQAKNKAAELGLKVSVDGKDTDVVVAQSTAPKVEVPSGTTITLSVKQSGGNTNSGSNTNNNTNTNTNSGNTQTSQ